MKYAFSSAVAALVIVGVAVAQTTAPVAPAAPAAPAPPSSCPAYPPAPTLPSVDVIKNQRDLNAGTELANAYLGQYNTVHTCRLAEIQALRAQDTARVAEAKAGQDGALAVRTSWQATADAILARGAQKKR